MNGNGDAWEIYLKGNHQLSNELLSFYIVLPGKQISDRVRKNRSS